MKVYFLDVGQGDCTFIKCPNGTTILVDCNISNDDFYFGWKINYQKMMMVKRF